MSQTTDVLSPSIPPVTRERPVAARTGEPRRQRVGSYLCLAAAAILFLFSNGGWIIPLAAWIWPVFLLRFMRTTRPEWGLSLAALALCLVAFVGWWGMVPVPLPLYFVIIGLTTVCQLLPFAIDRWLSPRFDDLARTLILPMAAVSAEFLNAELSPYGTWGAIGYTQFGILSLLQLVSVTGVFGIAFLIGWFAAVVNDAWEKRFDWPRIRVAVGSFAAVFAIVVGAGALRLTLFPPTSETVRVASITAPDKLRDGVNPSKLAADLHVSIDKSVPDALWAALIRNSKQLNAYLAEQSRREAQAGAKIVFWPEGQAIVAKESEKDLIALGRETARGEKIQLGMGMVAVHRDNFKIENRFVMLDSDGKTLFDYTKQMPVPGGEAARSIIPVHDYRLPAVDTPHGRIAGAICFDMDFPWLIRQAGTARVDILLAPSSDWRAIDPLHTHMACMRGIELGCSVVRHTNAGLSEAVDYQGHVLARMDHFTTPGSQRVMVAHVPVHGVLTIYARFGDLFSWVCVAALCALIVVGVTRQRDRAGLQIA